MEIRDLQAPLEITEHRGILELLDRMALQANQDQGVIRELQELLEA